MLRLNANNSHTTLVNCYRVLAANIASQDLSSVGSSGGGGRTQKQSDLALAAKVVRVIDTKMQPLPRAFYHFVYGGDDDLSARYGTLVGYLRSKIKTELEGEKDCDYVYKVVQLSMLAPWEVKHRMFNCHGKLDTNRGMLHSSSRLSELLGIQRSTFNRRYAKYWRMMLELLLGIDFDHGYLICDRVQELEKYQTDLGNFQKVG